MNGCPRHELLASYEQGDLTEAEAGPIEIHLRTCATCSEAMNRIRAANPDGRKLRTAMIDLTDDKTGLQEFDDEPAAAGGPECANGPLGTAEPDRDSDSNSNVRVEDDELAPSSKEPSPHSPTTPGGARKRGGKPGRGLERWRSAEWIIPDYERVLLCGEGSYGSVWAVRDRVGVYRALKIIDLERMKKAGIRCRETTALEAYCRKVSRHPYLITVFHVGAVGPYLYYTMELADDRTTHAAVHETFPPNYRPLTLDKVIQARLLQTDVAIEIARRLLHGLAKLHSLDLVHRDIKPSNIVFVNRHPKLADIGVLTAGTEEARIIGTPRYMPPDRVMDKTADIYAFGKVLHEMLAGKDAPAFPQLSEDSMWGSMRWDLERIGEVIARACARSAADRYATATAMLEDFEASTQLSFGSLFDGLDEPKKKDDRITIPAATLQLGFAFIRIIPWILLFILMIFLISRLP